MTTIVKDNANNVYIASRSSISLLNTSVLTSLSIVVAMSGRTSNLIAHINRCAKAPSYKKDVHMNKKLTQMLIKWVVLEDMPFDTLESPSLRAALRVLHPGLSLIGRSQTTRGVKKIYLQLRDQAKVFLQVRLYLTLISSQRIQSSKNTIHSTQDMWTSPECQNSYLAVMGCFLDERFVYHEVLLGMKVCCD